MKTELTSEDVFEFAKGMPAPYKVGSIPITKEYSIELVQILHKLIPPGIYCHYGLDYICPFWAIQADKLNQENGYCHYLQRGDWDRDGGGLLWDQCKECGINEFIEDETD